MRISIVKTAIILFWLGMNGWLLRYEAFPEKFAETASGYRALLQRGPLILDSWLQIECQDQPVGYSHTWVDTSLEYTNQVYTLKNQTVLNFKLMGQAQAVGVLVEAALDDQYRLQRFAAVMSSSLYATRIAGRRTSRDFFALTIQTPAGEKSFEMQIPDDVVLYSPLTEMALQQLKPGERLHLKTIDPLSLTVADLSVEAVRRENVMFAGRACATTVLNINYQDLRVTSWIDDQGRVLREETPFGWRLRAATPREILGGPRPAVDLVDLVAVMAVPVHGPLPGLRHAENLRVRLNGRLGDLNALAGPRQTVKEKNAAAAILDLKAQPPPAHIIRCGDQLPAEMEKFLAGTRAIQSDNEQIIRQARQIVAGQTNCFAAALAINEWVYRRVAKQPTVSLPSALDVLQRLEGDCNEHTYLFVALARAAGLPARINVGLVYAETRPLGPAFYYHAWPAVYVGEWVEMDPTLGLPLVNAAYIGLISGELEDQLKLLGLFGRLSVDILEEQHD